MSAESPRHPLQIEVWRVLDRVFCRKEWAFHLEVDQSEISRWATGSRAMSLDDIVESGRICERGGHAKAAGAVKRLLVTSFEFDLPVEVPSPVEAALTSGQAAGGTAHAIRDAMANGRLDPEDASGLRSAAQLHRDAAEQLDVLADQAAGLRIVASAH